MTTIELFAKNEVLELVTSPTVSSGDVNEVELYVEFGEEWQGLAKVAVFFYDEFKEPFERLLENGRCKVPNEVLKNHVPFFVGIRGAKNDILKTTDIVKYTVTKGVPSIIKDVSVDIYQQILAGYAKLETIKDEVDADAKKTAEDRKEVERLVKSVSGIDEQVAKVEKLSKDAQEAATQAGTSAGQAELHKQAAETAKESVENLSAQVQKNKESVDKTAQDFTLKAQQALADVNNAGQAQTERVQTAGTTAVENIKNAQNMATQAVETAKSEAIKAVQAEGTKQTGAVTAEGRKQVQAVQAATQEIIADREQITKNKTDIADLRRNKADAIVENVRGTLLNVKDSANAFFEDFSVYGKSEQVQTTGKNILPYSVELGAYSANTPDKIDIDADNTRCRITEPIQINDGFNGIISIFGSYQIFVRLFKNNKFVTESGFLTNYKLDNTLNKFDLLTVVIRKPGDIAFSRDEFKRVKIQLEKGTTATAYEPYTGGKPSPSVEYPQDIISAGKKNKDTGKYENKVYVSCKNLFDMKPLLNENGKMDSFFTASTEITPFKVTEGRKYVIITKGENAKPGYAALHLGEKDLDYFDKTTYALTTTTAYKLFDNNKLVTVEAIARKTCEVTNAILHSSETLKDCYTVEKFGIFPVDKEENASDIKYEPFRNPQLITLTSDRPITKWDKLVEQDGQIGWLYNSNETILNGTEGWIRHSEINKETTQAFGLSISDLVYGEDAVIGQNQLADKFRYVNAVWAKDEAGQAANNGRLLINIEKTKASTVEEFKEWLKSNNVKVVYKTKQTEFVPLPQPEQNAIRALKTYYPTTIVTNSEDAEMQLTYVADTKNYTDNKIKEAVSAQVQNLANLLSLMPLSTQAAMIEADTNNILDNMEVQK